MSGLKPDGGPAFPWGEHGTHLGGMTLREYFAAKAMQGILAGTHPICMEDDCVTLVASAAYEFADAMLIAQEAS